MAGLSLGFGGGCRSFVVDLNEFIRKVTQAGQ